MRSEDETLEFAKKVWAKLREEDDYLVVLLHRPVGVEVAADDLYTLRRWVRPEDVDVQVLFEEITATIARMDPSREAQILRSAKSGWESARLLAITGTQFGHPATEKAAIEALQKLELYGKHD